MSFKDKMKETAAALGGEVAMVAKEEAEAFFDKNQSDVKAIGQDAANQILLWARFQFTDIPMISDDASMSEIAAHEAILAKRDQIFAKVAQLEEANAEAVARLKAESIGFMKKMAMKLGQIGLKHIVVALIALV